MAQFPGFAPMGSGNGNADIGMTDADGDGTNPIVEPPTPSISRTADHFGKSLRISPRISPPKLSIPNPSRNYFAISAAVDPTFSTPPLPADDDMVTSSSGSSAPTGPPQVLPMTPVFYPDQVKPLTVGPPAATPSVGPSAPPPSAPGVVSNYESGEPSAPSDTPIPNPPVRNKVPLERGYSQMVWLRLMQTEPDLAGLKGESPRRLLTMDEIRKHKSKDEAWTVLRNRVYNITPYLKFHPGGPDMLMKAAGTDGTSLFNKYHAWVNAEFLMEKCLVGHLDVQPQADK